MSPSYINMLPPSQGVGYLMPSTMNNVASEEKMIEGLLKKKISSIRINDEHVATTWDNHLGFLLSTALVNYEFECMAMERNELVKSSTRGCKHKLD